MSSIQAQAPVRRSPARPAALRVSAPHALGFVVFLLVNAALFIRPGEVVPALERVELYQYVIVACLLVSFPAILPLLAPEALERRPIALCVLVMFFAILMSHLIRFDFDMAYETGLHALKTRLYFLLLLGLVITPARLRTLLTCLTFFTACVTVLAILDFEKVITLPRIVPLDEAGRPKIEVIDIGRMQGTGIFQDPNDLSIMIAVAGILAAHELTDTRRKNTHFLWVIPLVVFVWGFLLTGSRGGLLAVLAGVGTVLVLKFGWFRTGLLGLVTIPLLPLVLAGRQSEISTKTNTANERIQLWSDGLDMFRQSPVFGVGVDKYVEGAGHVAHNSYLHAFSETGFVGGLLYLGAFYLAIWGLLQICRPVPVPGQRAPQPPVILDPDLRRLYPYLMGALVAYAVGQLTLTLNYIIPTYTVLGVATVFLTMADTRPSLPPLKFDFALLQRLAAMSVVYLIGIYIFVRVFK